MYDLCVVGGGILGVTSAYRALVDHPKWQILLLEKGRIGEGASHYAVALSGTVAATPEVGRMSLESDDFYQELRRSKPGIGITELPIVYVVNGPELASFRTTRTLDKIDFAAVKEISPLTHVRPGEFLLRGSCVLHVDPRSVLEHYVDELGQRSNVSMCEDEAVSSVDGSKGSMVSIRTEHGREVEARHAIFSLGPWAFEKPLVQPSPETAYRVKKIVAMRIDVTPGPSCPVLYFDAEDAFLCPDLARGCYWFSIRSNEWDVDPGKNLEISAVDRQIGRSILEIYTPGLLPFYGDGRVFCDGYTEDGNPVIQADTRWPQVVIATGGNGRGVRLGPAIARRTLELLANAPSVVA